MERLADRLLDTQHPGTIQLTGPGGGKVRRLAGATGIRLADGRLVAVDSDEARYSTPELLAQQLLIDTAVGLLDTGHATLDAPHRRSRPGGTADTVRRAT